MHKLYAANFRTVPKILILNVIYYFELQIFVTNWSNIQRNSMNNIQEIRHFLHGEFQAASLDISTCAWYNREISVQPGESYLKAATLYYSKTDNELACIHSESHKDNAIADNSSNGSQFQTTTRRLKIAYNRDVLFQIRSDYKSRVRHFSSKTSTRIKQLHIKRRGKRSGQKFRLSMKEHRRLIKLRCVCENNLIPALIHRKKRIKEIILRSHPVYCEYAVSKDEDHSIDG